MNGHHTVIVVPCAAVCNVPLIHGINNHAVTIFIPENIPDPDFRVSLSAGI